MRNPPNFAYHFALQLGNALRGLYRSFLPIIVRFRPKPPQSFPFEVFAYSNDEMLPEQVASIRSFLRHVGRPKSFTVVSDGSHSDRSVRLLKSVDSSVSVTTAQPAIPGLSSKLASYLNSHPTGKQLALIMSLPRNGPALYVDADVRFFPAASDLFVRGEAKDLPAYYLADCQFAGDPRLVRDASEENESVNTGALFLFRKLDWSLSIRRFLELEGEPTFFTNQTMTHLTMHENGARPFDPAEYVLQLDDQCVFADRYAGPRLALRHYVNPVRHKFWTSLLH
ncbi:MAG: hypothetical protein QOE26_2963 [Verrucomicrobiota bacterium]|jgi:hypothetical protein